MSRLALDRILDNIGCAIRPTDAAVSPTMWLRRLPDNGNAVQSAFQTGAVVGVKLSALDHVVDVGSDTSAAQYFFFVDMASCRIRPRSRIASNRSSERLMSVNLPTIFGNKRPTSRLSYQLYVCLS
jgi:hypothetical protein